MTIKTTLSIFTSVALVVVLLGCVTPVPPQLLTATPTSVGSIPTSTLSATLTPSMVCVDFEPPITLGTTYGTSAGQSPGDVAFTTNGVTVTVQEFDRIGGGGTVFGNATIGSASSPFGSGQSILLANINLDFDFSGLGFRTSWVKFGFLDTGGSENFSVNGVPSPVFVGELSSAPASLGNLNISVDETQVGVTDKIGSVQLLGPVNTLRIGGQEFWIDNVCAQ